MNRHTEFREVWSGPCFACEREMSQDNPGALIRKVPSRAAVALCEQCLNAALNQVVTDPESGPRRAPPAPEVTPLGNVAELLGHTCAGDGEKGGPRK